ncbi:alanine racemase [Alicyclobacillus cycloheptanicus]|uniref:Alanine racemase n=1 Tax=Alicyclobacillus cycloheptanicus TaxID=1457 RepID=A0ABT9XID1_9BACL|nr:alanine racemase [Alicyclobacillus cycloheptanicus]MDQ0190072.1 alanine racemase [Alicyclobacillus cycloheptanicus]WDM02050.1 alanine racemase [Alicyclobacillus cycloheptanicus]
MYRGTFAIVDTSAIRENIRGIKSRLAQSTRVLQAVKANGYGHGAVQVARAAVAGGATELGVATVEEALALREAGIDTPILVLGVTTSEGAEAARRAKVAITIGNPDLDGIAAQLPVRRGNEPQGDAPRLSVHLKVDTGMSRLGARGAEEAVQLALALQARPDVSLDGVFTHLACADSADLAHAEAQIDQFRSVLRALAEVGIRPPVIHAANSAAALRRTDWQFDTVRVGIAAYGYGPAGVYDSPVPLRPALHLYSPIVRIATLQPGDTVGYGATYTAERPVRIATVPVGYGDGYFRTLSNRASVVVRGHRAPVVGNVCMDQLMIDVTEVPDTAVGDCVTLYGRYAPDAWNRRFGSVDAGVAEDASAGNSAMVDRMADPSWLAATFAAAADAPVLSLDELADLAGTISYELMCALSNRVPRIYV